MSVTDAALLIASKRKREEEHGEQEQRRRRAEAAEVGEVGQHFRQQELRAALERAGAKEDPADAEAAQQLEETMANQSETAQARLQADAEFAQQLAKGFETEFERHQKDQELTDLVFACGL